MTRNLIRQLDDQSGHEAIWVMDNGSGPTARRWLESASRRGVIRLVDAAGWPLHKMWNYGLDQARREGTAADVAVLNNDLVLGEAFLVELQRALHSAPDLWAVSPLYDDRAIEGVARVSSTFKNGGLAGFAFMLRADALDTVRFDEGFRWWYGDDDLVWQIEQAGRRVAITGATSVEHIGGGSRTICYTLDVVAAIEADMAYGLTKWFGQPAT